MYAQEAHIDFFLHPMGVQTMCRLYGLVVLPMLAPPVLLAVFAVALMTACGSGATESTSSAVLERATLAAAPQQGTEAAPDVQAELRLEPVDLVVAFPWLEPMSNMVHLTHGGDGSGRLYVVLQEGRIVFFDPAVEGAEPSVFLDIRDRVRAGGERGLLGLAFDPAYRSNGHFYVNYTTQSHTVVARYTAGRTDGGGADAESELVIMRVLQPYPNHNGGTIAFGPDGHLYIGLGDGGAGGDPLNSGAGLGDSAGGDAADRCLGCLRRAPVQHSCGQSVRTRGRTAGDMGLRVAEPVAVFLRLSDG